MDVHLRYYYLSSVDCQMLEVDSMDIAYGKSSIVEGLVLLPLIIRCYFFELNSLILGYMDYLICLTTSVTIFRY